MNLSAPTTVVFLISVALAVISLIVQYGNVGLGLESYYWALIAYLVLAAANLMKGI